MKKILAALVFVGFCVPGLVAAQTSSASSTPQDLAVLIAGLQAQITELQRQLEELQQNAPAEVTTSAEFVAVNSFTQTLSRGMFSEEVKELQRVLAQNPEIYPEGIISGYFGALTEVAVKRYQEANGVDAVGIVGPKTRALLNENVSSGGGAGGNVTQAASALMQKAGEQSTQVSASESITPANSATTTVSARANVAPVATQVPTPPPPAPASTGSYYAPGGYSHGTQTYVSEPTPPAPTPSPSSASSTTTASSTPAETPPPAPTPSPSPEPPTADTTGPTITNLTITPGSTVVGGAVSFSATAEDPSGIQTIVYNIRYPTDANHDGPYYLRPNCNYYGVTSGTCGFGESIDHGVQNPSLLGVYTVESIRIVDVLGNTATYYPDGTVTNGVSVSHSLTIPAITISAP